MILIVRMGGVEIVCDDEMDETRPTPECTGDLAKRIAAIVLDTYSALPDAVKVPADADTDDALDD
jgi:hypothetical protein